MRGHSYYACAFCGSPVHTDGDPCSCVEAVRARREDQEVEDLEYVDRVLDDLEASGEPSEVTHARELVRGELEQIASRDPTDTGDRALRALEHDGMKDPGGEP